MSDLIVPAGDMDPNDDVDIDLGVDEETFDAALVTHLQKGELQVPPFPRVVLELQQLSARDAGLNSYVDVVAKDPALAARVLRVANSASFGRADGVKTLAAAVTTVGSQALVRIALADGLATKACADGPLVALRDEAWRHAVTSAILASTLAPNHQLAADETFVCGLLHDFGRLLAVRAIEDVCAAGNVVAAEDVGAPVWRNLVAKYGCELGILAAEKWDLPESLRRVMSTHHLRTKSDPVIVLLNAVDDLIAVMDGGGSLEPEGLATIEGFSPRDVTTLSRALGTLPQLLASFTIERLAPRPATVEVQAPAAPPSSALTASTIGMSTSRAFQVQQLSTRGVVLSGRDGLAPNQVFRFRFAFRDPIELWLRITALKTSGNNTEVHGVPFALRGDDAGAWYARVRAFAPAA